MPISLKVFLTALAILDDLGAVVIIALFYTAGLDVHALLGALFVLGLLRGLNAFRIRRLAPYLVLGALLWTLMLKSVAHATIADVLLEFTPPHISSEI